MSGEPSAHPTLKPTGDAGNDSHAPPMANVLGGRLWFLHSLYYLHSVCASVHARTHTHMQGVLTYILVNAEVSHGCEYCGQRLTAGLSLISLYLFFFCDGVCHST